MSEYKELIKNNNIIIENFNWDNFNFNSELGKKYNYYIGENKRGAIIFNNKLYPEYIEGSIVPGDYTNLYILQCKKCNKEYLLEYYNDTTPGFKEHTKRIIDSNCNCENK